MPCVAVPMPSNFPFPSILNSFHGTVLCSQQPKFHALKERRVLEFGAHVHFRKVSPRWAVRPSFKRKSRKRLLIRKDLSRHPLAIPLPIHGNEVVECRRKAINPLRGRFL